MDDGQSPEQIPNGPVPDPEPPVEPAAPEAVATAEPPPSRFSRVVTTLWSMALVSAVSMIIMAAAVARDQLASPEAYLGRVIGRDLDAAEALMRAPQWEQTVRFFDSSSLSEELSDAIEAIRRYQSDGLLTGSESGWGLCVLLAESGRLEEAKTELAHLSDDDDNAAFKAAFTAAYSDEIARRDLRPALKEVFGRLWPEWVKDKLQLRLAARQKDELRQKQLEDQILTRGGWVNRRATILSGVTLLLVAGGVVCLALLLWRGSDLRVAHGAPISPWTLPEGYAVLVRGAGLGLILAVGFAYLGDVSPVIGAFATLLAALPMFWLAQRHLLTPHAESFMSSFGLRLAPGQFLRLATVTLAVIALMILGESILTLVTSRIAEPSLVESVPEEFLFDSWPKVLASSVDAVVWAPLVEEMVFRGMLYATLRRRMRWLPAALWSSAIFGAVHGYSLQGFLVICWSALLWAVTFEKTKSLWPGIICHAISNVLAVASPLVIYR